ncbi:class I SAM-dependent methyltransferase [Streptococcus suis]|uniref:class I SAM-dependent methyltransferase n=1 Tax=Streptococcus suis TaxID=1307 RepID=UPI000413B5A5|nr:class I SAM-dependent methyltransferase [Streptococcus suis]HEL1619573.1 class I SAM-dependent methyltransferase [Streptococcus suis]HEL1810979.1 class I SAM-dependent methyltransferase [Streptococcus suis]
MIVTTSLGMDEGLVYRARRIANELGIEYKERKKQSVGKMLGTYEAVLVLYKDKLILEQRGGQVLFFHPDTAMLRIKSGRDPLLELLGKEKQSIIDCTMGLGSDSIVLASASHRVTALESSKLVHFIVSRGLQDFDSGLQEVNRAMKSIQTIWTDSLTYLKEQIDKSVDVIYFDPMFSEEIKESQNLSGLAGLADRSRLTEEIVSEAKRVARKKLIIKAHFRDQVFEEFGFIRHVRPNQKFHYGEIILEELI